MLRFPQRAASQDRWFLAAWVGALLVTLAWEFMQLRGALVFDPLDLAATGVGAALAWPVYRACRRLAFRAVS